MNLSGNIGGALWILLSCLLFSSMGAVAKTLGEELSSFEVAFARALFGFLWVLPIAVREGPGIWRTAHPMKHFSRIVIGSTAMLCGFYALTHIPLAEATAISFTKPLFLVIFAALILHEKVRVRRWTATAIGLIGVLVMLRPGVEVIQWAAIIGIVSAIAAAAVSILIKQLVLTEKNTTTLLYMGLGSTLIAAVPASFTWITPNLYQVGLMAVMGALGVTGQWAMMMGFRLGEASALAPFDYARLPFAAFYGFVIFSEIPSIYTVIGTLIIVCSTLYIARREAQLHNRPS
ncbi:MAG: DMT family transporter [Pseudomonadota bacterium]